MDNQQEEPKKKSTLKTTKQAVDTVRVFMMWGKYLIPIGLALVAVFFAIMLFVGLLAGSSDSDCFTDSPAESAAGGFGGDWKDANSETHKAMQYAADQFKNELHMSGDNIAAALAIGLRESGFNPNAVNPSGAVKGIWQWGTGGINYNRYGNTEDTVEAQVALAIRELRTTHMVTLVGLTDASLDKSLEAWDINFEGLSISDPQRKVAQTTATAQEVKTVFQLDFAGDISTGTGGDSGTALDGQNSDSQWCPTSTGTASGLPVKGQYNITGGYPNYAGAGGSEHYGTDFQTVGAQESGEASNVYSVSDGVVVAKTGDAIGGNYVVIKNTDGAYAYYGHAPSQSAIVVNVGDKVQRGQHISHQGQTGLATGVHVHFGVNKKQNAFAPHSDGLISPGEYLLAMPKKAIPASGIVVPAGPFTADENSDESTTNTK